MVVEVALVADEAEVAEDLVVVVAEAVEEDSVEEEDLEAAAEDSVAEEDVEAVDLVVAVVGADTAVVVNLSHPENPNKQTITLTTFQTSSLQKFIHRPFTNSKKSPSRNRPFSIHTEQCSTPLFTICESTSFTDVHTHTLYISYPTFYVKLLFCFIKSAATKIQVVW